jgi:VanZ family protein
VRTQQAHTTARGSFRHQVVRFLAVLYALFIIQLTLIPFDFLTGSEDSETSPLFLLADSEMTVLNVASNVGLFIPFGLLTYWAIDRRGKNAAIILLQVIAMGTVLSALVEWIQAYSPSRVSSLIDLTCNSCGLILGAGLASAFAWVVPRLVGAAICAFHEQPRLALAKVYVALLAILALSPFTFAVDAERVKQMAKVATFKPFEQDGQYVELGKQALRENDMRRYALAELLRQRLWPTWAAQAASFALFVWLWYPVLRTVHKFDEPLASVLICWMGLLLAVCLSILQAPIISRGFHVTDILARMLGIFTGLILYRAFDPAVRHRDRARRRELGTRLALLCLACVTGFIVYTSLIPWIRNEREGPVIGALASAEMLPLYSYFHARFDVMVQDIAQKVTAYLLFGALLVMSSRRLQSRPWTQRTCIVAVLSTAMAAVLEGAQLFLLIRTTSLTDLLIALFASGTGAAMHEHAIRFYAFARSRAVVTGRAQPAEAELSLTDQLVATLTEPHPKAPKETLPEHTAASQPSHR